MLAKLWDNNQNTTQYCMDCSYIQQQQHNLYLFHTLTDVVAENVHILGEPISPIQLTQSIFGRSTHPVKVSKVIRPPRGPGAGTPGGFLILP